MEKRVVAFLVLSMAIVTLNAVLSGLWHGPPPRPDQAHGPRPVADEKVAVDPPGDVPLEGEGPVPLAEIDVRASELVAARGTPGGRMRRRATR